MKRIAYAIILYQADNAGRLPQKPSDLYPEYTDQVSSFYCHCKYGAALRVPSEGMNPKLIDLTSTYTFAPLSDGRSVIYERALIWTDHTIGYCVTVKGTHSQEKLQTGRVTLAEFNRRFLQDFKE